MIQMLNGQLFGNLGAINPANYPSLNQALIPYLSKPVYLRLTDTVAKAKNYAAAGFHVSVARGLSGGCSDAATTVDGTDRSSACTSPMGRDDAAAAWTAAADAYARAYQLALAGQPLGDIKAQLAAANTLSDSGYHMEGIAPPADPVLVQQNAAAGLPAPSSEPVAGSAGGGHTLFWTLLALGTATGAGILIYQGAKARTKRKSSSAYRYAY